MVPITKDDHAAQAKYELERVLLDGELRQLLIGETFVATLSHQDWELSVEWGKLIFAWWDEEHSQNWRVTAYEVDPVEVRLRVTRGLAHQTSVLTLRNPVKSRAIGERKNLSPREKRERYAPLLAGLLTTFFIGLRVQSSTTGADRARSVPGRFARLILQLNQEKILAIGVNEGESQSDIDRIIAAGLIWLAGFNPGREPKMRANRLWFCLPRGRSRTAIERVTFIDASCFDARIECFEIDERNEELVAVRPTTQAELCHARPHELRWPGNPLTASHWSERILSLAPELIEIRQRPGSEGQSFSINGLEFARVISGEDGRVEFGVAVSAKTGSMPNRSILNESNFSHLRGLAHEIIKFRSIDSPDRRHPLYRLRAETWLESLLRREIGILDATLDDRFVYSQIPTWRADERSVIDLLTLNRNGRLVVIEIKTAEDLQLPLQGLDYWLRIEQARLRQEFERRGLFIGARIADQSPLLYLVAPRLRFHRTFAVVARCLASSVEAYRIGINSNWRDGIHVHSRERINRQDWKAIG